jgi:DNA-binding Lrp family transcriptional regulator
MLTQLEKKILTCIQVDIPICERPYLKMAEKLGVSEKSVLETLNDLCERGVIRRFGATIRHQKSGFQANAMTAWKVDESRLDKVGKIMAASKHVSHCYRRNPQTQWPYNLYTMIHAKNERSCREIARKLAEKTDICDYQLLFSCKELKKTSMIYFPQDQGDK